MSGKKKTIVSYPPIDSKAPLLAINYSLVTMSATVPQVQEDFKTQGVTVTAEEILEDGIPIGQALDKIVPLFGRYPNLHEMKVSFEVEIVSSIKGGVEVKFMGMGVDAGGGKSAGKTHRIEFLLKNDDGVD